MNKDFWLEKWNKFLQTLKKPPVWLQVVTYLVTVISCVAAICIAVTDFTGTFLEVIAYALFGIAAISLAYSVFLIIPFIPRIKKWFIAEAEKREFTHSLLRNFGFRTIVFACGSFAMSIAFGVLNGYKGIAFGSIWFGALAAYYVFLAFLRGGILLFHTHKRSGKRINEENRALAEAHNYRNCGIILLILNIALSSAIAQMIFDDQAFYYADWTIFAYAAYAFFKLTMSIINLVRAKKQDDLTVQAIRNTNLIDATVSILALQTALLHAFTTGNVDISLFNTLTGSIVSLFSISLAILMIKKGHKQTKKIQSEKIYGKQSV